MAGVDGLHSKFTFLATLSSVVLLFASAAHADMVDATMDGFDQFSASPTACDPGVDCSRGVSAANVGYGVQAFTVFYGAAGNGPLQPGSPYGFTIGSSTGASGNAFGQLGPDFSGIEFKLPSNFSSVSIEYAATVEAGAYCCINFAILDSQGNFIQNAGYNSYSLSRLPGYADQVVTLTTNSNNIAALVGDGSNFGVYFDDLAFGYANSSLAQEAASTPEPGSLGLITTCGSLLVFGYRRTRQNS
jgi:hypothetical protein